MRNWDGIWEFDFVGDETFSDHLLQLSSVVRDVSPDELTMHIWNQIQIALKVKGWIDKGQQMKVIDCISWRIRLLIIKHVLNSNVGGAFHSL